MLPVFSVVFRFILFFLFVLEEFQVEGEDFPEEVRFSGVGGFPSGQLHLGQGLLEAVFLVQGPGSGYAFADSLLGRGFLGLLRWGGLGGLGRLGFLAFCGFSFQPEDGQGGAAAVCGGLEQAGRQSGAVPCGLGTAALEGLAP